MAQVIRTKGGYLTHRLTKSEQEQLWKELSVDVSPVGKYSLYTPQDDLEYFIIRETETSFEKYEAEIRANGKTFIVKYNWRNQAEKTFAAVRKAYGK